METGSKKHIIAERILDSGTSFQLCNLFVSDIGNYKVLSLYSILSKKLVGYKIVNLQDALQDDWLINGGFNAVYNLNNHLDFELVPANFSQQTSNYNQSFYVVPESSGIHIMYGIDRFMQDHKDCSVLVLGHQDHAGIVIYNQHHCVFSNSFKYADHTELLYYVVNAMQISGIKQEDANVILDYHCAHQYGLIDFLSSYFKSVSAMTIPFENPDPEIQDLSELLMPNHLIALCV